MDNKGKEGSYTSMILIMVASLAIAGLWESLDFIKNSIHAILDPSVGAVLGWNLTWGLLLVIFVLTIIMTLVQKYTTDQDTLKEMRKEQKILQEEMKKYKV